MSDIKIFSKNNGVAIVTPTSKTWFADPDGDFVAEAGALSTQVNIKRDVDSFYVYKNLDYTKIKDSAGAQIGTSRDNCVSVLNSNYFNRTSKIQEIDNVDFQNSIAAGQVLQWVDIGGGTLRISNETIPSGDLVNDTTPQLGGDLDVNGQSIVSTSNGNIIIQTDGTGRIGVNTSSPEARFHVDGETIVGGEDDTGPVKLKILGTGDRGGSIRAVADGFGSSGLVFAPEGLSSGNFSFTGNVFPESNLSYSLGGSSRVWLSAYIQKVTGRPNTSEGKLVLNAGTTSNPIQFTIADVEHARLNNDGNFGIGTTSPNEQLHVDGNVEISNGKIVSSSNGDIDIEPNGTGNVLLGNFKFDADQAVGVGQDDYVLTYDHTAGTIGLEAASGGGGGTITALNNQAENRLTTIGATTTELDGEANLTFDGTTLTVSGEVKADQIYVNARFPASPSNGHFTEGARIGRGFFTSGSITAGALYILGASSWTLADADAASTGSGLLVVATDAASATEVVLEGCVKLGSNTGFSGASKGDVLYLSTTGGEVTTTAPSATGDIVRVVGYVLNASNGQIYFNPDNTWLEI